MIRGTNRVSQEAKPEKAALLRRYPVVLAALAALVLMFTGIKADAQSVHFRYNGGRWSHSRHAGWHRYWGGPSIGFYYAPSPVYVVPGYAAPYYYDGPDFWYSDPSFGFSLNFGGGGYYGGRGYRYHEGGDRWHGSGSYRHYGGSQYSGGGSHYSGSSFHSGGGHFGGGSRGAGRGHGRR